MSAPMHTPWKAHTTAVTNSDGQQVAATTSAAIASLIAAAPELLEALENLANAASATSGFASPMFLKDARAVIAKAKGGAA